MSFVHPSLAIAAVVALFLLAMVFAIAHSRRSRLMQAVGGPSLRRMVSTLSVRRRVFREVLFTAAVGLSLFSLARPQVEGDSEWRQRGIDVAVVIDYSKSMLAEDITPSRLEWAKMELGRIVSELSADRFGGIAAAGRYEYFPLTHDPEAIRFFFSGFGPVDMGAGSDLGAAIAKAHCMLAPHRDCQKTVSRRPSMRSDRGAAIVVFSDVEDTSGAFLEEIASATSRGLFVYVVVTSTPGGAIIPEFDERGRSTRSGGANDEPRVTRLNLSALADLRRVIGDRGGVFAVGRGGFPRAELLESLDSLHKGDLDERVVRRPVEVFHWFLFPAWLLLLVEACFSERRRAG